MEQINSLCWVVYFAVITAAGTCSHWALSFNTKYSLSRAAADFSTQPLYAYIPRNTQLVSILRWTLCVSETSVTITRHSTSVTRLEYSSTAL